MKTYETEGQYPVTIQRLASGQYKITYGAEKHKTKDYAEAARLLGEMLMHAASCSGEFDK